MLDRTTAAEIAVELRLCEVEAADQVCFALLLESYVAGERLRRLELLAARIGLSLDATNRILLSEARRVELLAAAHQFFRQALAEGKP